MFVERSLQLRYSGIAAVDFFEYVDEGYGVEELDCANTDDFDSVEVPQCIFSLKDDHFSQVLEEINHFSESEIFGIDLYEKTLNLISRITHANPGIYT